MPSNRPCMINGCDRRVNANDLCSMHDRRMRKTGTTDPQPRKTIPAEIRFWAKVDRNGPTPAHRPELGPCWLWIAALAEGGYGAFRVSRALATTAHRWSYEHSNSPIPDGAFVCHHCDVPRCVRPEHLFLGTLLVNNQDMFHKGRSRQQQATHCPAGHEYNEENTFFDAGRRRCKSCRRTKRRVNRDEARQAEMRKRMGAQRAAKTHCPKNHPYDEANTRVNNGRRHCRACARERSAASRNTSGLPGHGDARRNG